MIVLRCTAKLLKRLRQPAKVPEPVAATNPLGEWYADVDFIDREPFVVMLNATTGIGMALPGRAEHLRNLHVNAGQQFFKLLTHFGFDPAFPACAAELVAWEFPPSYANTRDRSLLGSLNQFKEHAWNHFTYVNRSLPEAAAAQWEGLFRHPSMVAAGKRYSFDAWKQPLSLVAERLLPSEVQLAIDINPSGSEIAVDLERS